MLSEFEAKMASLIFCLLFLISAIYVTGAIAGAVVLGGFAIQSAALYVRIAREEHARGGDAWTQLVITQRRYRSAVWQVYRRGGAALYDEDQAFLNTYGGGGERLRDQLKRWAKRVMQLTAAGLVWLPAIAVHGAVLACSAAYGCIVRWLNE